MPHAAEKMQPYQPDQLYSSEQEPIKVREGRVVLEDNLSEYAWYQYLDLPSRLPESSVILEELPGSLTSVQANQEERAEFEGLRERLASSVVRTSHAVPVQDRFTLLQKWEGIVTEIKEDSILVRLIDLSEKGPDEEAEFPIEEIPTSDRKLVALGAVFYWCIGYLDTVHGQRIRASAVRFRRLPVWTKEELANARLEARNARDLLGWK